MNRAETLTDSFYMHIEAWTILALQGKTIQVSRALSSPYSTLLIYGHLETADTLERLKMPKRQNSKNMD